MKKLPRPLPGVSPKAIFLECVESFRDSKLKVSLMGCASEVKNNSDEFEAAAVNQFKGFQPHIPIAATSEQLEKVYTQKFVPKSSPDGSIMMALWLSRKTVSAQCAVYGR